MKINELVDSFLNIFHVLSKSFRRILKFFLDVSNLHRNIFYCIDTIAQKCKCSASTVKRATAEFERKGWIYKKKRGYNSNLYFVNSDLLKIDINNPETFRPEKNNDPVIEPVDEPVIELVNDPVLIELSNTLDKSLNNTNIGCRSFSEKKERVYIPSMLSLRELSGADRYRLAKQFTEAQLAKALEDARWYLSQGKKIGSLFLYMKSSCLGWPNKKKPA